MSRRVAVQKALPFIPALASAATGALAAGKAALATGAGKALVGGLAFGAGKRMASNAFKDQQEESESFTDKIKERGKAAADAGAAYAQANRESQQRMEERGQQMAEKAKAGSQIATGEAMDMSWQMLKAWSFLPGFSAFDKKIIIEHANKGKLKHVSNTDFLGTHHEERFSDRYKRGQAMPKGAENLEPRDLALAYLDLMLRRNPELIERANQKEKISAIDRETGEPFPDNFPGITLPLLRTDEPIKSQWKEDKGRVLEEYHPVFAAGHPHHEPSEHPKFSLATANDLGTQARNRNTIRATHTINRYSHDQYDIADPAAEEAYYTDEEVPKKLSQQARNKKIIEDEISRRHFGDFLQPIDFERMKQQGLGRSMTQSQAEARVYGQNPMAVDSMNPLKIYPEGNPLSRQFQASNPPGDDDDDDDDGGSGGGGRKLQSIATAPPIHIGGGMYMWQGNYYGGLGQPPLPPEAAAMFQTGEPMDMAWRMLKNELQLPHQITEALRDDLSTLDRAHKMTDTNEGTLIENIHPDMEQVVKLLAEKHLGELNQPKSRPPMPLFHGQFL